jgi:hypothetical protein
MLLGFRPNSIRRRAGSYFSIRQRFDVLTANQRCNPALVKLVSLGRQPREALLAQVTVENLFDKTITAVKLGWKVYARKEGISTGGLLNRY